MGGKLRPNWLCQLQHVDRLYHWGIVIFILNLWISHRATESSRSCWGRRKNTQKHVWPTSGENSTRLCSSTNARCARLMCGGHSLRTAWRGGTGKPSISCPDRRSWERRLCWGTVRRGGSDTPCCEGRERKMTTTTKKKHFGQTEWARRERAENEEINKYMHFVRYFFSALAFTLCLNLNIFFTSLYTSICTPGACQPHLSARRGLIGMCVANCM